MADSDLIKAWDTRTGEKLDHLVPRSFIDMFDYLSETPLQKAADEKKTAARKTNVTEPTNQTKEA